MLKKSRTKATALLCGAMALCLTGAVFALSESSVVADGETAVTYGYTAQFQDSFDGGQLKEGWQYVSNGEITDGTITYSGTTDTGKMLYDTGSKEYVMSVDINLTLATDSTGTIRPQIYMPVAVKDPVFDTAGAKADADYKVGQGVSLWFMENAIKFWDFGAKAWIKTIENSSADVKVLYENIPGYSDTWLTEKHTWTLVVGKNYIECYVDDAFVVCFATPAYLKADDVDSLMCGLGGGAAEGTISYDNFTVYTKADDTPTNSMYIFSETSGQEVWVGTEDTENDTTPLVKATRSSSSKATTVTLNTNVITTDNAAGTAYKTNRHWMGTKTLDDFTMTLNVTTIGTQSASGIYFGATETSDGAVSGYRLAFCNGTSSQTLTLYTIDGETDATNSATLIWKAESNSGKAYNKDYPVTLKVEGKVITLSYTDTSGAAGLYTYTAAEEITGQMGLRLTDTSDSKDYKAVFSVEVETAKLSMESASEALTDVTVQNATGTQTWLYSARKDGTITADMLDDNVVGFLDSENKLYGSHSVADGTTAKVLTVDKFVTEAGAAVRIPTTEGETTVESGLRFTANINKAEFDTLVNEYGVTVSEMGMLLLPVDLLGGELTHKTAKVAVKATAAVGEYTPEGGEACYRYRTTLVGIPEAQYTRTVAARGYMVLSYTVGEETFTRTLYTEYKEADHARSIQAVATAALADTKTAEDVEADENVKAKYAYKLSDGTYSCYTEEQRKVLETYVVTSSSDGE